MNVTPPKRIILASTSPRRQDFLREWGIPFTVVAPDIDETLLPGEKAHLHVMRIADEKARAALDRQVRRDPAVLEDAILIAADTTVAQGERIMGKPADHAEAREMLLALSGRTHQVISGLCLLRCRQARVEFEKTRFVTTDVTFRELTDSDIGAYIKTGSPFDKAGGYGIQDCAGTLIKSIRGSYTNVVGLPMAELADELAAHGVRPT